MELDNTFDIRRGLVGDDFIHNRETILCERFVPALLNAENRTKYAYTFRFYAAENKLVAFNLVRYINGGPVYTESKPWPEHERLIRQRLNLPE